jgi:acetyl-CoA carboxylase biotin carboxyl carrier protein
MSATNTNGLVPVEASVTSVFYRRPSPGEPAFVEEGDMVNEDTIICLLEIMKCFRSVAAGVKGTVEKVLVESAEMVNAGDTLMLIRPDK